jgi:hypothetical protein
MCRHSWGDNAKTNLKKIGYEGVDWIHLAEIWVQFRAFVNTVMALPFR